MRNTREISVFVDESGSFEPDRISSRFYLVCMVFHNQATDITSPINTFESSLEAMGLDRDFCIHAGPLIRREEECAAMSREVRRGVFRRMFLFLNSIDITYHCFTIDKNLIGDKGLHDPLLQQIIRFLVDHALDFSSFEKLKIYYDNGQSQLKQILREAFAIFSSRTEFVPNVTPIHYRLFQAADIICTLELARAKLDTPEGLSESENIFFGGPKNLKKNYLKILDRKLFQ